ncbi:carbohydrate ABC transporter permease [Butyrivibrio sp. JL13D10]|uniref:carbohydrate ABC transporter permease n=1 Tax=Butyrivibrio sp. JL13D10 TaxID=3236815 RepID=UPI0038B61AED
MSTEAIELEFENQGHKVRYSNRIVGDAFVGLVLVLIALLILIPVIWMLLCAFRPESELMKYPPKFFPESFTIENFSNLLQRLQILTYLKNSIIYCIFTTVPQLFINSLAGYAFARYQFKGKNVIFIAVLATMMIPFQVIMVPLFLEVVKLGMYDNYAGLLIPNWGVAICIFMTRAAYAALPKELEEAARMDGLSEFGIYWKIMTPLIMPTLMTNLVLGINGAWNDLLWPLLMTSTPSMRTLANGIALFLETSLQYGTAFAGAFISVIPMMILYIFGQQYFVEGTATSGLKG